jgi:hypothetical protein
MEIVMTFKFNERVSFEYIVTVPHPTCSKYEMITVNSSFNFSVCDKELIVIINGRKFTKGSCIPLRASLLKKYLTNDVIGFISFFTDHHRIVSINFSDNDVDRILDAIDNATIFFNERIYPKLVKSQ